MRRADSCDPTGESSDPCGRRAQGRSGDARSQRANTGAPISESAGRRQRQA